MRIVLNLFSTKVFGVVFSCIILGEAFNIRYFIAGIMVAMGIKLVNRSKA